MELEGENVFKIRAYRKAADTIEELTESLEGLAQRGELETVPNIGKGIGEKITEMVQTGQLGQLEELRARIPAGLPEVLNIPGLGPRSVKSLHEQIGVGSLNELEAAAKAGRVRGLPGMGAKTEENILKGIEAYRRRSERMPIGKALPYAENLVRALRETGTLERVEIAGSLRRMRDTVGDVDLVATASDPAKAMAAFVALPQAKETLLSGETRTSIRTDVGLQVDLRIVKPEDFGALLHHFTGSREHNIRLREMAVARGAKINEYGVFDVATGKEISLGEEEADLYRFLGLPYIPPELREDHGEIEAARENRLPRLIEAGDIRGNLHGHSDWSDGAASIEVMVNAARALGHAYIAITDHSKALGVANGLDEERLRQQGAEIDAVSAKLSDIRILKGIECDILADGSLDLDGAVLDGLDIVIGSVHSRFNQDTETITGRVIRAMESGHVDVIAHPTGRLLGHRDPYAIDVERLIDAAAATKTALEINAFPDRLDLCDVHARRARDRGVLISINTDAHHPSHLSLFRYGIGTARRAWLEAKDVLNTWSLEAVQAWLRERKRG
jgi:DNA polymerase (family 10)